MITIDKLGKWHFYLMEFEFKIWMLENPEFKITPPISSSKHNIIVNQQRKKKKINFDNFQITTLN